MTLAITYSLDRLPADLRHVSPYTCSEGVLHIHVDGKDLCELSAMPKEFQDHLFPYLPWLIENFEGFFTPDPFPLESDARTAAEFEKMGMALLRKQKSTVAIERMSVKLGDWLGRHAFAAGSDGGYPPNVFFRKVDSGVEVSWDNSELKPYRDTNRYRHERGMAVVNAGAFRSALSGFMQKFLTDLRGRHPDLKDHPEILAVLDRLRSLHPKG